MVLCFTHTFPAACRSSLKIMLSSFTGGRPLSDSIITKPGEEGKKKNQLELYVSTTPYS